MKNNRKSKIKPIIEAHIINNKKEYIIVLVLFIIGLLLGVLLINNTGEEQIGSVENYINTFIEKMKNTQDINSISLLQSSILKNIIWAVIIWFFGTTLIGIPIVFGIIIYRGFCLGYTISACVVTLGTSKGLAFILSGLMIQNIILIPVIIAMCVSGFKLYKTILKDKKKDNIRLEILRHTVFCILMILCVIVSSLVEVFVSDNLLRIVIQYL